jgi:hypothetical protein
VLLWVGTGNQEVVEVSVTEVQSSAEGHPHKLDETEGGDGSCFGDVGWFNGNLMIRANKVDLGEDI